MLTARPLQLLFLGSILIYGCTDPAPGGVASDEAIARIALPEEQLRFMLPRAILSTQTAPMAIYALGMEEGCKVMDAAVDGAVTKNLRSWSDNLIAAYRTNVPAEVLASAIGKSPSSARRELRAYLPVIGRTMEASSRPLLEKASVAAIDEMMAKASKIDVASVSAAERQRELSAARATGEICGVGRTTTTGGSR
jgi:hypothetical protein